jgi:iron complex transport system ATP-binding protein
MSSVPLLDPSVPLIDFQNVTIKRGDRVVLDSITLSIAAREHAAILGPNGSGKSSLIKAVSRELYPIMKDESWSLRILGRDKWNLFELRNQLGIVSNDWMEMCTRPYSGLEIVLSGFFGSVGVWPNHTVTREMERKAQEVMELLEISHLISRDTDEMSSGEARRILIARALVHDPQALVLDEPTNSLDFRATYELRELLRKLAFNGIGIIMVTHHLPDIIPEISRVFLISGGRVVADGPKERVLSAPTLSGLFGIPVEVLQRDGYYHIF